ncbi:putative F-box domain-containing protein [Helianthus anomalus]
MATAHNHHLCPELIVEIFTRLPTQSLIRFRSVSKSICGMIGSPDFIRLHSVRSPKKFTVTHRVNYKAEGVMKSVYTINPAGGGQLSYIGTATPVEYPFKEKHIVGSCNGIICVYEYDRSIIHLWNPSIRRKVTLRFLPPWLPGLALGFGFDPSIEDYKILWTASGGVSSVYTMKTHTWREIHSPAMDSLSFVKSPMCLFDGALYWAVKRHFRHSCCYMMTFDLSSEVFSTIELPEPSWETNTVTVIKGCLAVVSSSSSKDNDSRIWVRTAAAASWSLAFKLDTRQPVLSINGDLVFSRRYPSMVIWCSVVVTLLWVFTARDPCRVVNWEGRSLPRSGVPCNYPFLDYHDPETGVPSRLVNLTNSSYVDGMITYIESLELLHYGTSCDQGKQIKTGFAGKHGFICLHRETSCDHTICRERGILLADTKTTKKKRPRPLIGRHGDLQTDISKEAFDIIKL